MRFLGLVIAAAAAITLSALTTGQALATTVHCGDVITQDTTLDSDLDCTGNGLVVQASGVTLDLGGHTVRGDTPGGAVGYDTGIRLQGSRITIKNGAVEDFADSITVGWDPSGGSPPSSSSENLLTELRLADSRLGVFGSGGEIRIENNRFVNCGVYLGDANRALIQRNEFDSGGKFIGMFIDQSSGGGSSVVRENVGGSLLVENGQDLTVELNRFSEGIEVYNTAGAHITRNLVRYLQIWDEASNSTIEHNLVRGGGIFIWADFNHGRVSWNTIVGGGVQLRGASDNWIEGNSIRRSSVWGMLLHDDSNRNLIVGNSITGSGGDGIWLNASFAHDGTAGNVIEGNLVSGSGGNGVLLKSFHLHDSVDGQTDTILRDNVIRANAFDGVAVDEGSPGTLLQGNTVLRNDDDGLDLKDPATSVFNNKSWFNGDLGIDAVAGVTGGGNWAKHNGNPLQCVPGALCSTTGKPKG